MKTQRWQPPSINQSPVPDRWGPVDLTIAAFGIVSFAILMIGSAWNAVAMWL